MSAVIQLCGLTRQFGGLAAVRNVTMAVEENEIRGLIGPNGAGKTTVLGLIGGQLKPSAGTVAFQGIDISRKALIYRVEKHVIRKKAAEEEEASESSDDVRLH